MYVHLLSTRLLNHLPARELEELGGHAYTPNLNLIIAFDALNVFAVVTLSTIFLTAWFSRQVRRVSTWFLYIFSWAIFSLGYLLILGNQTGPPPRQGLCFVQAMMIYATPAFASTSIVVFVLQIFIDIRQALVSERIHKDHVPVLIAIPPVLFFAIISEVLFLGLNEPETIERDVSGMFCHLSIPLPSRVTGVIVLINILIMVILGVLITTTIRRNRETWLNLRSNNAHSFNLVFRVSLFILAPVIATGIVVVNFLPHDKVNISKVNVTYAIRTLTPSLSEDQSTHSTLQCQQQQV
ncbi:unnamed protein product [Cyclocybe aegerita]|uniref:Uncharacterized protein n=1 Tax=Cyclocybe aegerita TaxID=1973307 RepID=A0A8S0VU63_CYCAE|nr:unnamed protein product [Cyclocybe aegerita]